MEINHFFSTPVFLMVDNNHEKYIDQLKDEIYKMREDDEGIVRSNKGGWHSDTRIFHRTEPGIKRICNMMIKCFHQCTKAIAPEFEIDLQKLEMKGEGWVNVNPQNTYNVPHDHPGYTWSGVYYAHVPPQNDVRSGNIEFLDPRTCVTAFATDVSKQSEYFSPKRTITPKSGMILVFPSYLRHWVYPNEEDEDRITFAFNFKYAPKSQSIPLKESSKVKKNKNKGPVKNKRKK